MAKFTVPPQDEHPSEEFVEALADLQIDWDGDDWGLNFYINGDIVQAGPGDIVEIVTPTEVYVRRP